MHDVYQMHRTLLQAYPDKADGGSGSVLWRLDTDRRTGISCVLVQSSKEPNWQKLTGQYPEYLVAQTAEDIPSLQSKPLPELRFRTGQCLAFRLRANPTIKRDGTRHGLLTEEEQAAWLYRKAEANGFRAVNVLITPESPRESSKKEGRRMKFVSTLYEGRLVVAEPDAFLEKAIESGIGSAKAFGFGLLSVART
jgi:CRISPR system Cascade subunit CasE